MWPFQGPGGGGSSSTPPGVHVHRRCFPLRAVLDSARSAQSAADLAWGWDQATLAQSFSTMGLTPPVSTEWIADSGASFHTTPDDSIFSSVRPLTTLVLPSWLVMGLAFLSPPWVLLLVLFFFTMSLLLLRWFITILVPSSLILLASL